MYFYIILFLAVIGLFFFVLKNPKSDKIISLLLLVIMIVVGGFRDHIGWDYFNYTNWYLNGNRSGGLEFGFVLIIKFLKFLKLPPSFLFFFCSFFTYVFAYLGIKKYAKNCSIPMVFYFLVPVLFLYSFTYIRQYLSVAIAFYAFSYLLEKKYWSYFLLMFFAISIHYTCLVAFVIFLIVSQWGHLFKTKYLVGLMGVSFVLSRIGVIHFLQFLLQDSHYLYYVVAKFSVPVPIIKLLVFNVMGLVVLWFYEKYGFKYGHSKYLVIIYICSIIFLNLFAESTELTRIYIYFRIFEIILVADILSKAIVNKKVWLMCFIGCFYILAFFRAIVIDFETPANIMKLIPYKTILLKNTEFL